jgi:hypothetical protein
MRIIAGDMCCFSPGRHPRKACYVVWEKVRSSPGDPKGVAPLTRLQSCVGADLHHDRRTQPGQCLQPQAADRPRIGRTSTSPTASTSKTTNDPGCDGARRRSTVAAVLTIRCCNASKSSRSPVHTTSSPFISGDGAAALAERRSGRCRHVYDGGRSVAAKGLRQCLFSCGLTHPPSL